MNYVNYKGLIVNSEPSEWNYDDDLGRYVLRDDIRISILSSSFNDREDFYEDWARNFPDSNAQKKVFYLQFNGVTIEQFFTVAVDGYRSFIPYPSLPDMTITREQYSIGAIVNTVHGHNFDEYLAQANIKVI